MGRLCEFSVPESLLIQFNTLLTTLTSHAQQRDLYASTQGSVNTNLVQVYLSLGGGWEIRTGQDFIPASLKDEMESRTNWGDMLTPKETEYPPSQEVKSIFHKPDW